MVNRRRVVVGDDDGHELDVIGCMGRFDSRSNCWLAPRRSIDVLALVQPCCWHAAALKMLSKVVAALRKGTRGAREA